ncbi:MAG: peptidylprolyl isomerase [Pseudomonadota bacterium]
MGNMPLRSALGAACAFALAGCDEPEVPEMQSLDIDAAAAATVNGQAIYTVDVDLEAAAQGLIEPGELFGPTHPDYQQVLDQIIDQALLAQEATARGLHLDANARRRLESARERVLGNLLVESLVAREVTEDSIRMMYEEQAALQQIDDEVSVRHILVSSEDVAEAVHARLERGDDFTTVAFETSEDTASRIEGGALGYVEPNQMGEPFASEIANTPTGAVSEPFQSEQGWHIIKVEDRRTPPPKTLDEMRSEIVTFLTYTEISKILKDLRAKASIGPGDGPDISTNVGDGPTVSGDPDDDSESAP